MDYWKKMINQQVKIIYDDFGSYPKKKVGVLIGFTATHLILKINSQETQAILLSKILRLENKSEEAERND